VDNQWIVKNINEQSIPEETSEEIPPVETVQKKPEKDSWTAPMVFQYSLSTVYISPVIR